MAHWLYQASSAPPPSLLGSDQPVVQSNPVVVNFPRTILYKAVAGPPEDFSPEQPDYKSHVSLARPTAGPWQTARIPHLGETAFIPEITSDMWASNMQDRNPRINTLGAEQIQFFRIELGELIEEVTLDKWYTPFPPDLRPRHPRLLSPPRFQRFELAEAELLSVTGAAPQSTPVMVEFPKSILYQRSTAPPVVIATDTETVDQWYSPLTIPFFPFRQPLRGLNVIDPNPIPDEDLLPKRIPYDVPLAHEFNRFRMSVLPPVEETIYDADNLDENITLDKYDSPLTSLNPYKLPFPAALVPFQAQVEQGLGEFISVDMYFTPLSYNPWGTRNWVIPGLGELMEDLRPEDITIDKYWVPLHFIRPAPKMPLHTTFVDGFEPILDVAGLPLSWYTALGLPVIFPVPFPEYRPFQNWEGAGVNPFMPRVPEFRRSYDSSEVYGRRPDSETVYRRRGDADDSPPQRPPDFRNQR